MQKSWQIWIIFAKKFSKNKCISFSHKFCHFTNERISCWIVINTKSRLALFFAITFEIEFHDCVVLCDLTNFDHIKKSTFNSFLSRIFFILLSLIGYFVLCSCTHSLCHHEQTCCNPSLRPEVQTHFLCENVSFMLNREISFYWFYLFWHFSSYQAVDQRFFPRFPINYEICQTHIKLWLWPTLRDLLKNLDATLNWEIRDGGRWLVVLRVHALAFIWSIGDKPAGTSERELFIIALRCCLLSTSTDCENKKSLIRGWNFKPN